MDYSAIKTNLTTDPDHLGYASLTDPQILAVWHNSVNAVKINGQVTIQSLLGYLHLTINPAQTMSLFSTILKRSHGTDTTSAANMTAQGASVECMALVTGNLETFLPTSFVFSAGMDALVTVNDIATADKTAVLAMGAVFVNYDSAKFGANCTLDDIYTARRQ